MANHIIRDSNGNYHIKSANHREILDLAASIVLESINNNDVLNCPDDTRNFLKFSLSGLEAERFCVLYLDNRNRVIKFETAFHGTVNGSSVHPREIVKRSLQLNACAVIFAHNHPSGYTVESSADKQITNRLKEALNLIDVRVLDHFIVGDGILSFAEKGIL